MSGRGGREWASSLLVILLTASALTGAVVLTPGSDSPAAPDGGTRSEFAPLPLDDNLPSWNPNVECAAKRVTIQDLLGPAYPGQSVTGAPYETNGTRGDTGGHTGSCGALRFGSQRRACPGEQQQRESRAQIDEQVPVPRVERAAAHRAHRDTIDQNPRFPEQPVPVGTAHQMRAPRRVDEARETVIRYAHHRHPVFHRTQRTVPQHVHV